MHSDTMSLSFNEWMRRYITDPKSFEAEFESVGKFLAAEQAGKEPTYGETCTAYIHKIASELAL